MYYIRIKTNPVSRLIQQFFVFPEIRRIYCVVPGSSGIPNGKIQIENKEFYKTRLEIIHYGYLPDLPAYFE